MDSPNNSQSGSTMLKYRNQSLFLPHNFRQAIEDNKVGKVPPILGYFIGMPSIEAVRKVAPLGYDFIFVRFIMILSASNADLVATDRR